MQKGLICFAVIVFGVSSLFGMSKRETPKKLEKKVEAGMTKEECLAKLKADVQGKVEVKFDEKNGTPTFLKGNLPTASESSIVESALKFLDNYKELFLMHSPGAELKLNKAEKDKIGMTHVRLDQSYKGIPVWASQIIVHFDKERRIYLVNGRYEPTPAIETEPDITEEAALMTAKGDLEHEGEFFGEPTCELVIYPLEQKYRLAWLVNLKTVIPPADWRYFVDAKTGEILLKYNDIKYDGPTTGTGLLLNGNPVNLDIYDLSGTYYLVDASKPMWTGAPPDPSNFDPNLANGTITTLDAQNYEDYDHLILVFDPNGDKNFNDNEDLKAAVCADYYVDSVYSYYYNVHGRNSWDGAGGSLLSVVNFGQNYCNAFWNGYFMTFGDGDGTQMSNVAGALDIIAHEATHAVTESTANLVYLGMHGALNESFSDFFGCMIDREDWYMGEDIMLQVSKARDLSDPHDSWDGQDPLPAHMSEYIYLPNHPNFDQGGVHINCLIPAHAGYLLANSITKEKTEELWYRALAYYLVPRSFFIDLRRATIQSALDLYPLEFATNEAAIQSGFDAVGIVEPTPGTQYVLGYDDGNSYYVAWPGYDEQGGNWMYSVRFHPDQPCSLIGISMMVYDDEYGDPLELILYVCTDTLGAPYQVLFQAQFEPISFYPYWQSITFNPPIVVDDQCFHIVIASPYPDEWIGAAMCIDNGSTQKVNCYDQYGNGNWMVDDGSVLGGDLMIRAVVTYSSPSGVEDETEPIPASSGNLVTLLQNYPNPFNPETRIKYTVDSRQTHPIPTTLKIYNILGQLVKTLVDEAQEPGSYEVIWDGKDEEGNEVASGIYFHQLKTEEFSQTKKMVLIR